MHRTPLAPARALGCALALALALGACQTTRTEQELSASPLANVTRTRAERAWKLVEGETVLGIVVHFVDPEAPEKPERQFYSVRNVWQQELGTLDAQGRAYRFVPHQREASWVGTGTVLEGARAILGGGAAAELTEVSLEALRGKGASAL